MKKQILLMMAAALSLAASAFTTDEFTIRGATGSLHAVLERPDVQGAGKTPLVILCHGFGGNSQSPLFDDIAKDLLDAGIAALRFDFNGHGRSEGLFQDMTVPNEIQDLCCVVDWAKGQPWVENISLLGHSQGGVVVSMVAGKLDDGVVKSLVLMAPAAVLRDDALRGNTMGTVYDPFNIPGDYVELMGGHLKLGKKYIETAQTLPIYETAEKYEGPVLVVHGTHDRVVPYTYGQRYHYGYKHSDLELVDGDDHGFSQTNAATARLTAAWLVKHIRN